MNYIKDKRWCGILLSIVLTVFIEWNNSDVFSYVYSVFEIMIAVMFVVSVIILSRKEAAEDQTI